MDLVQLPAATASSEDALEQQPREHEHERNDRGYPGPADAGDGDERDENRDGAGSERDDLCTAMSDRSSG